MGGYLGFPSKNHWKVTLDDDGYIGIIDQLTIDETNKLRCEVETSRVEKNSWEAMRRELDDIKELLKQGLHRTHNITLQTGVSYQLGRIRLLMSCLLLQEEISP
ncbi:MAG TPA: hypothetical protein VFS97_14780 [Nitrososphaeraceae archaeon]|nr:hypothetical protein [Nitrososphaeraceae archaeon]